MAVATMTLNYRDQRTLVNSHELMEISQRAEEARRKSRVILSLLDMYRELCENINYEAIEEECKTKIETLSENDLSGKITQTKKQLERYRIPIILFERFHTLVSAFGV